MINERDLQLIINKYNLHLTREKKVLILNNSTLEEVDKILNYLINELKIDARNIEKCPSILYKDYETIRENYEFLEEKEIFNYSIETCLHILETDPIELNRTYNYIIENYDSELLNKNTSILKVPVSRIENVEKYLKDLISDQALLGACITSRTVSEMLDIVRFCKKEKVKVTSTIFKQQLHDVKEIIRLCRYYNIEITGSIFHKNSESLKLIINYCIANNISLGKSLFACKFEELDRLLKTCQKEGIDF